ncbi:hypothetical protein [Emticicia fontis]
MQEVKMKIRMDRAAIGYTYPKVVSEFVRVQATKVGLEKLALMVGTFLPENSDDYHVSANKIES